MGSKINEIFIECMMGKFVEAQFTRSEDAKSKLKSTFSIFPGQEKKNAVDRNTDE